MSIIVSRSSILLTCFFFSGASGLAYEVIWLRMLGLVFGHTVYAITTVLVAFMAGLALGSFVVGRRATHVANPVRAYGLLEVGIGLACAAVPGLLWLAGPLYLGLHRLMNLSYDAFSLVQFLIVFALLLVPTTLMGGTLPMLSQALVTRGDRLGQGVGALYAINTLGAVAGLALVGYVLLPALGNRATSAVVALVNLAVGVVAIALGRNQATAVAEASPGPSEERIDTTEPEAAPDAAVWLTVVGLGVSGAIAMVYEVAWTRALALVIGSSTFAFTAMLVAFLIGIGGGSALYAWLWGRRRHQVAIFAMIQAGIGVTVALALLGFERMPELFLRALVRLDSTTWVRVAQLALSSAALVPFALLLGATFPCAVAVAARSRARVGRDVGRVYAANTLGAIVGTALAGFVFIPALGIHTSIKLGVVLNLGVAIVLFAIAPRTSAVWRWSGSGIAVGVLLATFLIAPWDQRVMVSGPAIYAKGYRQASADVPLSQVLRARDLVFYADGPSATVSVQRAGDSFSLQVNGKTDASVARSSPDMPTQVLLGHLGLLMHSDPREVLVIGLGSGTTAGAVARYPVDRLDIAEIEPAVVKANTFFANANGRVLEDARVRTVIADARNFLLTTRHRYDVIISEPSNPWIGGVASLFTIEFFEGARVRLRPGGIMVQWIHAYSLLPDDLRMVVKTFRTVFPGTSVWRSSAGDYLLVGQTEREPIDIDRLKARYESAPAVRQDLGRIGIRAWPGVFAYLALGEADAARYSASGPVNTDDRLTLEFSAPLALYLDTAAVNWRLMKSFKTEDFPAIGRGQGELEQADTRYLIGTIYADRQMPDEALAHFRAALKRDPAHVPSLVKASELSLRQGQPTEALGFARRGLALQPANASMLVVAGLAAERVNAPGEAVTFLERAIVLQPDNAEVRRALWKAEERRGKANMIR